MEFGKALKEIRTKAGLSQWELAKVTGIGRASIARIETNRQNPSLKLLERLAAGLGISVLEFVEKATGQQEIFKGATYTVRSGRPKKKLAIKIQKREPKGKDS